jgi:hypothetical protein
MKSTERITYFLVIFALLLALVSTCGTKLAIEENAVLQNQEFKSKTLKDSSVIYSQSLTIINQKKQIAELKSLKIKNPEVVIKTQTKTVIKTQVQLDTVMIEKEPHIRLPRTFHIKDKWFEMGGAVNRLGMLQIDSLVSHASFTYVIGDTLRSGFLNKVFGKKDKVLSLKIDNPTMQLDGMSNIVIKEKKRWYETTAFKFGLGVIVGAGVMRATN